MSLPSATDVTAKSKSNFVLSFLLLPKERREGMINFYALSRLIDDAVDEHNPEEARSLLSFWRNEIELCYTSYPTHPVAISMLDTISRFEIPKKYLDLLIEGCEMDLEKKRYANFEELYQYCYRVAGVIGLTCMRIFGLQDPISSKAALNLGLALQLTNILRDIPADVNLGRVYLPQDELKEFNLSENDLKQPNLEKLAPFMQLQAKRAEEYFNLAFSQMLQLPRRPLRAAWIMGRIYFAILQKIKKKNYDVFSGKISISKFKKIGILLREVL